MGRLLSLAFRNLFRNRRRTALSLVAIMVGVGAMVTFRGFVNGQRDLMISGMVRGQTGALQVHRRGYQANVQGLPLTFDFEDTQVLRARISGVEGVAAMAPRIAFGGMLSTPDQPVEGRDPTGDELGKTTFLIATAIDPEAERAVAPVRLEWVKDGRVFERADASEVVLNADLARSLGLRTHPRGQPLPPVERMAALLAADRDGALNGENVVLSGELAAPMPGDRRVGLVPLRTAQRLLRMEGRVTEYAVAARQGEDLDELRDRIAQAVGPEMEVHTWAQLMPFVHDMMAAQDFVFSLVSFIFLVVVLLGIVNSMLMNVLERVREIGTMMAVGMRRRQVVAMLVLEGTTLGVGGGVLGVLLGAALVAFLHAHGFHINAPGSNVESTLRPFVTWGVIATGLLSAPVGTSLAALWPAYRASLLRPVDALRSV